jgi:hypothetical protein
MVYQVVIYLVSYAIQPQTSAFTTFPTRQGQQIHPILCQLTSYLFSIISELFAKSSHLAHCKALNESIISFTINILRTLWQFPVSPFSLSCLFSCESELFAKKQGGGVGGTLAMSSPPINSPQTTLFLFINLHRASSLEPLSNSPRMLRIAQPRPLAFAGLCPAEYHSLACGPRIGASLVRSKRRMGNVFGQLCGYAEI